MLAERGITVDAAAVFRSSVPRSASAPAGLGLSGVRSVLFGGLLVAMPAACLLSLAWVIGFRAVLSGAVLIALAFRLRRAGKELSASRVTG